MMFDTRKALTGQCIPSSIAGKRALTLRFALTSPPAVVKGRFGHHNTTDYPPRMAIAPTEPVLVVRRDHVGRREVELVRWGLIPSWVKEPQKYAPLFNARAETAADKPSFRGPLRHRRCLVPADAFYEWAGLQGARKRYLLRLKAGGVFGLASLWDHWLGADGSEIETMAILTVPASEDVAHVVERLPVIIMPEDHEAWLYISSGQTRGIAGLLKPAKAGTLAVLETGKGLSNDSSEDAEVQELIEKRLI